MDAYFAPLLRSHRWVLWALLLLLLTSGCRALGPLSPLRPLERISLYHPADDRVGDWNPADLRFEDVEFDSLDGTKLHGWFLDHPHARETVLVMHGNAGNVALLADTLKILNERHRLAVFAFDYRGFGKSQGQPNENGIMRDARAARNWLAQRKQIPTDQIVLMGQSLGGAVAINLASTDKARGLVVISSFTSMPEVSERFVPWLLPGLNMTQRYNSLEKIGSNRAPVLIVHGDADRLIPIEHGQRLFDAATEPKRFLRIPGNDHNDPLPESYRLALDEFLDQLPPG